MGAQNRAGREVEANWIPLAPVGASKGSTLDETQQNA